MAMSTKRGLGVVAEATNELDLCDGAVDMGQVLSTRIRLDHEQAVTPVLFFLKKRTQIV